MWQLGKEMPIGRGKRFTVMTEDRRIFVDTNVFLAATDKDREGHRKSVGFLNSGLNGEVSLFICGQIIREYLVVATRPPENNGLGLDSNSAHENVNSFLEAVGLLDETRESINLLLEFVKTKRLKGKRIHDANILAVMKAHGVKRLCTRNPDHFKNFGPEFSVEEI